MPKPEIVERTNQLLEMTARFSEAKLNAEYKKLCENLVRKMARKREVPFVRGRIENWAAAVIYALAQVNFTFDKSQQPHTTPDELADFFGVSKSTASQKAQIIRKLFKMSYWADEFSTMAMKKQNPFRNLLLIDGIIVDVNTLPEHMKLQLLEMGIVVLDSGSDKENE